MNPKPETSMFDHCFQQGQDYAKKVSYLIKNLKFGLNLIIEEIENDKNLVNEKRDKKINDYSLYKSPFDDLIKKISKGSIPLQNIIDFNQGIITGSNKKFLTNENNEINKKVITGSDFNRYSFATSDQYVIYDLERLHRPRKKAIFEVEEKIFLRQTGAYPICTLDVNKHYTLDTVHNGLLINDNYKIKYIVTLLNSKLLCFLYESQINETGKVFAQVKIIYVKPLLIKEIEIANQQQFAEKADQMLSLNKEMQEKVSRFINRIKSNFEIGKISKKLEAFYDYEFKIFVAELKKQKVKLSLVQQDEWEEYFNAYKAEINTL